jgi:hypothetical protein
MTDQRETLGRGDIMDHYKRTVGLSDPEGVLQRNPQTPSVARTKERSIAETVGTDPGNKIQRADARLRRGMRPVQSAKVSGTRTSY